jgi:hypothetical protein
MPEQYSALPRMNEVLILSTADSLGIVMLPKERLVSF